MARINAVSFRENPSIESICRIVLEAGFDSIEVSRPPFFHKLTTTGLRRRFAAWSDARGLGLYGFDGWVEVEPYARFDETLAGFAAAVQWAAELNLGMLISHDPWASVNGDRSPGVCMQVNVDLFRRVAEMCHANQLRLMFEPHPDTLSMDNGWAMDFVDAVADGYPPGRVGIVYDCCHYGVGQPDAYLESIPALGARIGHLHFSDGDKETYALHLPLGDGTLDLAATIEAFRSCGFDGTLTNDLYNYPLLEDGARRNADRIRAVEHQLGLTRP